MTYRKGDKAWAMVRKETKMLMYITFLQTQQVTLFTCQLRSSRVLNRRQSRRRPQRKVQSIDGLQPLLEKAEEELFRYWINAQRSECSQKSWIPKSRSDGFILICPLRTIANILNWKFWASRLSHYLSGWEPIPFPQKKRNHFGIRNVFNSTWYRSVLGGLLRKQLD